MAGEAAAREPITVGTFCSGTDAPIFALRQASIPHRHVFSAETNKHARTFIQANCPPETLYGDIMTLDLTTVPRVDLFVAGPPCTPWSTMNQRNRVGTTRVDIRVSVFRRCLDYIATRRPSIAVIENVTSLRQLWGHGTSRASIWVSEITPLIEHLTEIYEVGVDTMNPRHYGCPQHRPRMYVILKIRSITPTSPVTFPEAVQSTQTYFDLLSTDVHFPLTERCERLILKAHSKYGSTWRPGIANAHQLGLCMVASTVPFREFSRCIIASCRSFVYDNERMRFLTNEESFRLQGFISPILPSNISNRQLNILCGNAMNVCVLEHVFKKVILDLDRVLL